MEGSLSARWITCLGFSLRCDRVAKVVQSRIANYFQVFPPLVFSDRLFIFTKRGNFQVRVWRKFAAENRVNFQKGDWTKVKWSSQSRKSNFLTVSDLAFGFVHKRSGNEIRLRQTWKFSHLEERITFYWLQQETYYFCRLYFLADDFHILISSLLNNVSNFQRRT